MSAHAESFTTAALVAHLVGDYVFQSDWMATEKTKKSVACLAHGCLVFHLFAAYGAAVAARRGAA